MMIHMYTSVHVLSTIVEKISLGFLPYFCNLMAPLETKLRGVHWQQFGFLWAIKTCNLSVLNGDVIMHKQLTSAKRIAKYHIYKHIQCIYTYIE